MKLYKGSIVFRLAVDIAWYGNVPYSALKLYPHDYESVKDAVQKLIRVGDVAMTKAKKNKKLRQNIRILHITPQGRKAVEDAYIRSGVEVPPPTPSPIRPRKRIVLA